MELSADMIAARQKLIDKAVEVYAESVRKSWQSGGRNPKTYHKTQGQLAEDKAQAKAYEEILRDIFGWVGNIIGEGDDETYEGLYELAQKKGLLLPNGKHKDDPTVLVSLTVKGK